MESETKRGPPPYDAPPVYPDISPASQPAMAQPGAMGNPTVVVPTTMVMVGQPPLGSKPQPTTCRSCNQQIITTVKPKNTTRTHLFALGLCAVGLWCCVCIPYMTDSCRNADHYCPNCEAYIGSYDK